MPQGKVKWFNNAKGYGFIIANEDEPEFSNEDLFAHFSSIQMEGYKTLKAGQDVSFDVIASGKGHHAVNITPVGAVPSEQGESATQDGNVKDFQSESEAPASNRRPAAAHA
jgi:CspA family cold shock protein